jgi:cytoskeletal protein RodZ
MKEEKVEQANDSAEAPQAKTEEPKKDQEIKETPSQEPKAKKRHIRPLYVLLALVLAASLAGAGYLGWQYRQKTDDNKNLQQRISDLSKQLSDKEKELKTEKEKNASSSSSSSSTTSTSAATLKENVAAALNSGNTAALEGYMANSVQFVLAASEYGPTVTPSQAVKLVSQYTRTCTAPWDFNLSAGALTDYRSGDYSQYFPTNSIVGKSSDNCVILFTTNNANKINVIFFTNAADLL